MNRAFRIFAVGASAGGYNAVMTILKGIPESINAAFLVVIHSSFDQTNYFSSYLQKRISLSVNDVEGEIEVKAGNVYLSKTDFHLYAENNTVSNIKGPRENLFRPAIDVLFRSSAVAFGHRCVGVLLTGRLSDGTSGLGAIKQCGGLTVIQNPETAQYSDMPGNALAEVEVDYIFDLEKMAAGIIDICHQPLPPSRPIPDHVMKEALIATAVKSQVLVDKSLGEQVPFSCASCGGPLWQMNNDDGTKRYRCHVGHSFTQEALLQSQNIKLEETLWVSLRTLEEKKQLLSKMSSEFEEKSFNKLSESYRNKILEIDEHIKQLKNLIQGDE